MCFEKKLIIKVEEKDTTSPNNIMYMLCKKNNHSMTQKKCELFSRTVHTENIKISKNIYMKTKMKILCFKRLFL